MSSCGVLGGVGAVLRVFQDVGSGRRPVQGLAGLFDIAGRLSTAGPRPREVLARPHQVADSRLGWSACGAVRSTRQQQSRIVITQDARYQDPSNTAHLPDAAD